MDRTERLYKINELLRARKVVSFASLLAKVETLWFSPTEVHALLSTQQPLAGLDAGGVLTVMATQPPKMMKDSRHCESHSDVAIHAIWGHGLPHCFRNDEGL